MCMPTVLDCAGVPHPTSVDGVTQKPIEGTSMRYTFDAPDSRDRRRTQYFEMCGNRGIYHEGWMAVTRHGMPWEMVPDADQRFADDVWELYRHRARLDPGTRPRRGGTPTGCASCRTCS